MIETDEMNPFVRYVDDRICSLSYNCYVMAYEYRLFYVLEGYCKINIDGNLIELKENSVVMFPPKIKYKFLFARSEKVRLYIVNFDLNSANTNVKERTPNFVDEFDMTKAIAQPHITPFDEIIYIENMGQIEDNLRSIYDERQRKDTYYSEFCSALLKNILVTIARKKDDRRLEPPRIIGDVQNYIHRFYTENITNESIAEKFSYHSYYLNRCFQKYMGITIHQYLIFYRLNKACYILKTTERKISQIVILTGFVSVSYFSKYFKSVYGITPNEYRKANKLF